MPDLSRRNWLKGIVASVSASALVVAPVPELWEPSLWKPGDPITGIQIPNEQTVDGRVYLKTKAGQFVSLGGVARYDLVANVDEPFKLNMEVYPNTSEFMGMAELLSIALIDDSHRRRRISQFEEARKLHGL